ncbi:hypothetical protein BH09PSE2_BH09PSE2_16020 [soil metagenome]
MNRWLRRGWALVTHENAWLWEASAIGWALLLTYYLSGHDHLDWQRHALGRDYVNVWTAGHLIAQGRTCEIFTPKTFLADIHAMFDKRLPMHFWSYPPMGLLLAAPLGLFPYFAGLWAWTLAGLAALWPALRAFFRSAWTGRAPVAGLVALSFASPAVSTNIGLGQNGAFTAALLLGGLSQLERRPYLAGALLCLLCFKPQIAILLPVMVLAGGRWKVMAAAVASALALTAFATALYGIESWRLFISDTLPMQGAMLSRGHGPFQWMMPSAFMAGRILHLPYLQAMTLQAPFTLAGVWMVWRAWRSPAVEPIVRAAILCLATFVASPQAFNYDLIPALAATALLWRLEGGWDGWSAVGRGLAIANWTLPVSMVALQYWSVPITPVVLLLTALRLCAVGGVRLFTPIPLREREGPKRSLGG